MLSCFWTILTSVEQLNSVVKSVVGKRRFLSMCVNFVTNCVPAAQIVRLLLAPVVEPPENSCRMKRVFSIFLLLPAMAMVICRGKPSGSVFVNTNVASWGRLDIAKSSTHRAKMEEKDFIDKM